MAGPSAHRLAFLSHLRAPPTYLLFTPWRAPGGTRWGGMGVAGYILGFTPQRSAQMGTQGKRSQAKWERSVRHNHENQHKSCNKTRRERET